MREGQTAGASDGNAEALRRMAAEQLARLMETWLYPSGQAPQQPQQNQPVTSCPTMAFCEDLEKWFAASRPPAAASEPVPAAEPAKAREFAAGLEAYQRHPVMREKAQEPMAIWQRGTTKLRDAAPQAAGQPAVLIVPSLINRSDIFDLAPDHSFLRFLAGQGLRPLIVDWGEPGDEEKNFTVSDYIVKRLYPVLDSLTPRIPGGRVHLAGYCMGGLLAVALALLRRDAVASLTLMATPWNFAVAAAPSSSTGGPERFSALAERIEPYLATHGHLPNEALRAFFASLQPDQVVEKFSRFSGYDPDSAEAKRFVLSEDWLNDGVPLAAPVARECLREWYGENRPGRIMWRVAGALIDPRLIDCPAYIVAPGKDHLVPPESSKPLARFIRGAKLHEPALGHIGILASHVAPQEVWTPLAQWLSRQ